jgi:beta-carotene hydroxylase
MRSDGLPPLVVLGTDLLRVPRWRVAVSLTAPFTLAASYFVAAASGWWAVAVAAVVVLSFVTYGSVSHDLVHRSLGLSPRVNDWLLTIIEGLLLRSGRAYRLVHLHHHARFPHPDDPEARAARGSLTAALLDGLLYVPRLWLWAVRNHPGHRFRLVLEASAAGLAVAAAILLAAGGVTAVPAVYVGLVYAGTWVIPLATAYVPHAPAGDSPLTQTRLFRGVVARVVAADHLYHLEHHLYPAVPHHRWPELARRLDPHFLRLNVEPVRFLL